MQMCDPATREIPLRGKLIWTNGLVFITFFLLIVSIIVENGYASYRENPSIGPSANTLIKVGGSQGYRIHSGEWWRLFWAPFLHAGWIHFILNIIAWYRICGLLEPDWGFFRTILVFVLSAFTGNLISATLDPSVVSVGSSGGIFGIVGALIPYIIEYWDSIPNPKYVLATTIFSATLMMACGFLPYVDNYAHIGGVISGVSLGFATITRNGVKKKNIRKKNRTVPKTNVDVEKSDSQTINHTLTQEHHLYSSNSVSQNNGEYEKTIPQQGVLTLVKKNIEENKKLQKKSLKQTNTFHKIGQFITNQYSKFNSPSRLTVRSVPIKNDNSFDAIDCYDIKLWIARCVAILLLVTIWLVFSYFLFICPTCYTPPGQIISYRFLEDYSSNVISKTFFFQPSANFIISPLEHATPYYFPINKFQQNNIRGSTELNPKHLLKISL